MAKFKDLAGLTFGRLTVIRVAERRDPPRSNTYWVCRCVCGSEEREVISTCLTSGLTISCGCAQREMARARLVTHGMTKSREFRIWQNMKDRCTNPKNKEYGRYGGRGISFDPSFQSFEAFYAAVGPAPEGMTLDRKDNSIGYVPGNLRWVDGKTQSRNTRRNRLLTFGGKTQSMAAWAEELGIPSARLRMRIWNGWSAERALSTPAYKR